MTHRFLPCGPAPAWFVVTAFALLAPAQATHPAPPGKTWTPPRTPDGHPDFQGIWATATLTPLERPPEFAGKEFLSEREAADFERRRAQQTDTDRRGADNRADLGGHYNEFWRDVGPAVASRRTSLIVDPPDGRIPAFTAEGARRRAAQLEGEHLAEGPEGLPLRLRCITRGLPMVPTPNNNFFQIVQAPGTVAILQEMMYEVRIIPIARSGAPRPHAPQPHVPQSVRGYMGDAVGHWEGDTLVIDTTNFIGQNDFHGADENMHLVERLTRVDQNTILYRFTLDDPTAFTKPWSAEIPMRKSTEGIFDYECHEGNYSVPNILAGARASEKNAEKK
jgi:hypothetical protein